MNEKSKEKKQRKKVYSKKVKNTDCENTDKHHVKPLKITKYEVPNFKIPTSNAKGFKKLQTKQLSKILAFIKITQKKTLFKCLYCLIYFNNIKRKSYDLGFKAKYK